MLWAPCTQVAVHRQAVVHRRDFLRGIGTLGVAAGAVSWSDWMTLQAAELRAQGKACILLWMQGGPSQFETFDPKPGHANGGETKAISTRVPGIQVAGGYPQLATVMDDIALIRSMTSKEGNHQRATYQMHTGYLPTASIKHPTFGAAVAQQIEHPECELPAFVRVGGRGGALAGGGYLGVEYDPFLLQAADRPPSNTQLTTDANRYQRRLGLLGELEQDFAAMGGRQEVADHAKLYDKAAKMVLSPQMKAFDLAQEPASVRAAYGQSTFGNSCLLARRLVETGVTFIEITHGNWDTHQDNFTNTANLAQQIDGPMAALLRDLKSRGLLESTLVMWMGEFGRTPRINPRGGRDHYPRSFNAWVAGGGIRGGQVIGSTDPSGSDVKDRPVTVNDLFRSSCQALEINADHENMSPIGRPMKTVDGGQVISELFA